MDNNLIAKEKLLNLKLLQINPLQRQKSVFKI